MLEHINKAALTHCGIHQLLRVATSILPEQLALKKELGARPHHNPVGSFSVAAVLRPCIHPALFNYRSQTPQGLWPHTCNNSRGGKPLEGSLPHLSMTGSFHFFFLWLSLITAVIHKCVLLEHTFNSGVFGNT